MLIASYLSRSEKYCLLLDLCYLADLITAEGERQFTGVERHIFGQRHRQVKPQCQVTVALLEAIDLLFGFTAALGKKDLSRSLAAA